MKIRQKLQKSYIILIIIVIFVASLSSLFIFQRSLNSYIEESRSKEFNQIATEISELSQLQTGFNTVFLSNYVKDKTINLTFYNPNNQVVAQFIGLEPNNDDHIKYINKTYVLIDKKSDKNLITGYLKITYAEDILVYDQSTNEFYREITINSTILFIIALLIASIVAIIISKNLTDPIIDLQKKAKQIRDKDYNLENKTYNIYELDELSRDMNYLSNSLQEQEEIRINYSNDIAHELRTPITNLMLHLEGIRDDIIDADKETVELLISEIYRINGLINNLESTFNSQKTDDKIIIEKICLSELLNNILSSFSISINNKNIKVNKSLIKESFIESDRNKLTQIFSNLISNAIKAVDNEGEISITQKSYKNREIIIIADNGIGMSQDDIEKIFDRFYRVDNVRNTKVSGHGLGLSITKTFVDLLGYNLTVNSTLNKGSEFILTIPK